VAGAAGTRDRTAHGLAFGAGVALIVLIVCLPYAVAGELHTLWRSAVVAALARSAAEESALSQAVMLFLSAFGVGARGYLVSSGAAFVGSLIWLGALLGVIASARRSGPARPGVRLAVWIGGAMAVGVALSGGAHPHYLIQLAPIAAVFLAVFLHQLSAKPRAAVSVVATVLALLALSPVGAEYGAVLTRWRAGLPLARGIPYDLAAFLQQENPSRGPVFILADQLTYWLLGTLPPTRFVTHPSSLTRPAVLRVMGTTPLDELAAVFRLAPAFVVMERGDWVVRGDDRAWLEDELTRRYERIPGPDGLDVYRRRNDQPAPAPGPVKPGNGG
jgi:hypothetical protein